MQSIVVILGTGGTIAGVAPEGKSDLAYQSAQLSVEALVQAVPELADASLETEQVAQVDSKDMTHAIWQALSQRVQHHLQRDEVAGVVITHGTDTMEETAYLLHRVLAPSKPRGADWRNAPGQLTPGRWARQPGACGGGGAGARRARRAGGDGRHRARRGRCAQGASAQARCVQLG